MSRSAVALLCCVTAWGQIRFEEISDKSGLEFVLRSGAGGRFHLPELMLGGVAAFDYDGDGCSDLYFANGAKMPNLEKSPSYSNRLYRNRCDMSFEDVTASAEVAGRGYSIAVAAADYDNDGWVDLFVAGVDRNTLYRNQGDGTFFDATEQAGLTGGVFGRDKSWSAAAGWFDADNDGLLDLWISNYVRWDPAVEPVCGSPEGRAYCHPDSYQGTANQVYRNNGDGSFSDVSDLGGLAAVVGRGMSAAFADHDLDGDLDVFVTNDSMRNFLYRNEGDFRFSEVGLESGVGYGEHGRAVAGMGADFRDLDEDGFPDIVLTAMINDTFLAFRNIEATGLFEEVTTRWNLAAPTRSRTGWGLGAIDFDNDGWKDLFFATSHFPKLERLIGASPEQKAMVLRNDGGRFTDVSERAGLHRAAQHRGAAFADFDGDGRVDIAVSAIGEQARLFRNVSEAGRWTAFRLRGVKSNRDGLGARIRLTLDDGSTRYNHAFTAVGYASSSEPIVRFGLGDANTVEQARIIWPNGEVQEIEVGTLNQIIDVVESTSHPETGGFDRPDSRSIR